MGKIAVFFDLECTSISSNPNNVRIVEFAAIKVDMDTLEEIDRLYFKCNNECIPISKEAYEIHGISNDDVLHLPTFTERAQEVFDFINGYDIGGYNCVYYDIPILYLSLARAGLIWDYRNLNVYDVYLNYRHHNSGKLAEVYKRYTGNDLDNAHDACVDTLATLEVYKHQRLNNEEFPEELLPHFQYNMDIAGNYMYRVNETTGAKEVYINFGKWKGTKIDDIDTKYLEWVASNTDGFPLDTIQITKKILKMRGKNKRED
jgi:DNA polymerase-3 subunit epsilon